MASDCFHFFLFIFKKPISDRNLKKKHRGLFYHPHNTHKTFWNHMGHKARCSDGADTFALGKSILCELFRMP